MTSNTCFHSLNQIGLSLHNKSIGFQRVRPLSRDSLASKFRAGKSTHEMAVKFSKKKIRSTLNAYPCRHSELLILELTRTCSEFCRGVTLHKRFSKFAQMADS